MEVVPTLELPYVLHINATSACEVPYSFVVGKDYVTQKYQYINCSGEDSTATYTNDIIRRSSSLRIYLPAGQRSSFKFTIAG